LHGASLGRKSGQLSIQAPRALPPDLIAGVKQYRDVLLAAFEPDETEAEGRSIIWESAATQDNKAKALALALSPWELWDEAAARNLLTPVFALYDRYGYSPVLERRQAQMANALRIDSAWESREISALREATTAFMNELQPLSR
jgi:hypothetical protein